MNQAYAVRVRISAVAVAVMLIVGLSAHDAAAVMNVAMSPTSGPSGTTVSASSNDVCEPHAGSIVAWEATRTGEEPPLETDGGWEPVIESDRTPADGDAPWSGTFKFGETSALQPGAYTIFFACGYYDEGTLIAYGDYSPKAFEVCGAQACDAPTTAPPQPSRTTVSRPTATTETIPGTASTITTTTATTATTTKAAALARRPKNDSSAATPLVLAIAITALAVAAGVVVRSRRRVT